jgi:pyridoxamine 5'-phosphate oxidase
MSEARAELVETQVASDPFEQFGRWFSLAQNSGLPEPNAMALATVDAQGQPSLRTVLLRGWDADGFTFYTNYESKKGRELAGNPRAALLFYWNELHRQIRVEGTVAKLSREESDAYFASRPRGHRLSAWVSEQSRVIPGREALEEHMLALEGNVSNFGKGVQTACTTVSRIAGTEICG